MFIVKVRLREVDLREGDEVDRLGKEVDLLDEDGGKDLQLEDHLLDADVGIDVMINPHGIGLVCKNLREFGVDQV